MRTDHRGVVLPALCAALLTACTAGGGPVRPQEAGITDLGVVARDRIGDGGTLRWPVPELPRQWNFNQVNGMSGVADTVLRAVLPYPMRTAADGTAAPDPDYLLSARIIAKRPRQVVRYRLNPKARWSDGTSLGFRDFAAQARALSGRAGGFRIASDSGYRQITKVARGRSDDEVVVTFRQPFADWRALFTPLYPASANTTSRAFNGGWTGRIPVTAGPFRVARFDAAAQTVRLTRDPSWWGRPAKLDAIEFRALDPAATAGAFANGEVDLLDIGTDAAALRRARSVPGAVIRRAAGPDWRQITLNAGGTALADVRVRRAVFLSIDRALLAESALKDLGWPARTLDNHFYMNGQLGYRDTSGGLGLPDPGRAARLLEEAGWRLSDGRRVRKGAELRLRYLVPAGVTASADEARLVAEMLRRAGIGTELVTVPQDQLIDRYVVPGAFDLAAFAWLGTPHPASSMRSVFARPSGSDLRQNFARAGSARIDRLLDAAGRELDPERAARLVGEADALVWREAGVLPLYQRPQLVAVRKGLAGVGAAGLLDLAYPDLGFTR
ncbi:ABC transporter family substrate-binding protein [Actinocorallia longicatena]|uniref:ABC transporter family substrate-binding protein n=1 Tax=Actinocorallia longicatena TaxID=111803 RepID=A0ABP6QQM1_9ACTN